MRYGVLSDIHGNLEALRAVLDALREEDVDSYVCLGDIVGYGANPRECLELIRRLDPATVAGNHDYGVAGLTEISYFNSDAREAVLWTQNQLEEKDKKFLAELEPVHNFPGFTIVHATLKAPEEWNYILSTYEAHQNFQLLTTCLLFVGHSHVPIIFEKNAGCRYYTRETVNLEEGRKYIINVGSVGQPRDGDPRASFALYDTESQVVRVRRVEYNITGAMKKIVESGLPEKLAWRLSLGE